MMPKNTQQANSNSLPNQGTRTTYQCFLVLLVLDAKQQGRQESSLSAVSKRFCAHSRADLSNEAFGVIRPQYIVPGAWLVQHWVGLSWLGGSSFLNFVGRLSGEVLAI
jgi:hypothetical protein